MWREDENLECGSCCNENSNFVPKLGGRIIDEIFKKKLETGKSVSCGPHKGWSSKFPFFLEQGSVCKCFRMPAKFMIKLS